MRLADNSLRFVAIAAVGLFAGCAVGPNYHRPEIKAPATLDDGPPRTGDGTFADLAWWDVYRDKDLQALIHSALANGFDARIAAARVEQYRGMAAQARGQLFPGVGYAANADRGRNAQLGNAYTQGNGATANGFDGYLGVAWELDFWGRVRRLDEAAQAQYLASEEARRGVLLSLVSEVATSYFDLVELDSELVIAKREQESFANSLKLFTRRLEGGVGSRLETASAEAAVAAAAARVPDLQRRITQVENQLCVLIGQNPGSPITRVSLENQAVIPDVPAGLPSLLLERRPDIRQAEAEARAANAGIGVTIGGFLPRIGLSAILGGVSPDLDNITSGKARLWSVGAQATGPLFQGGGLSGQYHSAQARWDEAKLNYQKTALTAFAEVADALLTREKLGEVRVQQERAVKAYNEALDAANQRYGAGHASYYEVLQAQQQLFPAEVTLAQIRRNELVAAIQLYRALGGGWNLPATAWADPK